jgi:hypothetical protein
MRRTRHASPSSRRIVSSARGPTKGVRRAPGREAAAPLAARRHRAVHGHRVVPFTACPRRLHLNAPRTSSSVASVSSTVWGRRPLHAGGDVRGAAERKHPVAGSDGADDHRPGMDAHPRRKAVGTRRSVGTVVTAEPGAHCALGRVPRARASRSTRHAVPDTARRARRDRRSRRWHR